MLLLLSLSGIFSSCDSSNDSYKSTENAAPSHNMVEGEEEYTEASPFEGNGLVSASSMRSRSNAAENRTKGLLLNRQDSLRKLIKTADLKFRTKDVQKTNEQLEIITAKYKGFIIKNDLHNNIDDIKITPLNSDSAMETTFQTISSSLTLRVPMFMLDSVLKEIAKEIDHLDYKKITGKDVTLELLANQLAVERYGKSADRIGTAIDQKGKKLNDISDAEALLQRQKELIDQNRVATLSIDDKINYSNLNLEIYQRQIVKKEIIPNYQAMRTYKPSFFSELGKSLKVGLEIMEMLILFLAKLWLFLVIGLLVLVYLRFKKAS